MAAWQAEQALLPTKSAPRALAIASKTMGNHRNIVRNDIARAGQWVRSSDPVIAMCGPHLRFSRRRRTFLEWGASSGDRRFGSQRFLR